MGVKAMNWAFEQPVAGNEKCVLLALADFANDQGVCWPGQDTVAKKAYISVKTVQRMVVKLEERGMLYREPRFRNDGVRTSDLTVLRLPGHRPDKVTRGQSDLRSNQTVHQATTVSEEPSVVEPSESLFPGASARVTKPKLPTFNRKPVTQAQFDLAVAALEHLAGKMGRSIAPLTGRGEASENLKRILGRVLDWPDLTLADHKRIIDNNFAAPWWKGEPSVGVVYGPKVFEDAMAAKGAAAPKDETKAFVASMRRKFT